MQICQILTVVCRCHSDSKLFYDQVRGWEEVRRGGGISALSHSDTARTREAGAEGGTLTIQSSKSVPWVTVTQLYYKCFQDYFSIKT